MPNWALVIAIEDYPNISGGFARKLSGTNQSAQDFLQWVSSAKGVPATNIVACADGTCAWRTTGNTRREIIDAFAEVVTKARAVRTDSDELFIFFAGHGLSLVTDKHVPPIDLLIGSDFVSPPASGGACITIHEIKESLRVALGQGKHFYFVDACRNPVDPKLIRPAGLDVVWGHLNKGNATTYVLFSTAPGDVARVNSGFGRVLLDALGGLERSKGWVGGKMFVTFDRLCKRIRLVLQKDDLDPERKGTQDDNIVELAPVPVKTCQVEVLNGQSTDSFNLKITDVRLAPRPSVTFQGLRTSVPLLPEDYLLDLRTAAGIPLAQVSPPASPDGLDLYEDRTAQFVIPTPGSGPTVPPSIPPLPAQLLATLQISGAPNTELQLRDLSTDSLTTIAMVSSKLTTKLKPGSYKATIRDGNFELASRDLALLPGGTLELDFKPEVSSGAHSSLLQTLPTNGALVDFSETLSDVPDWNLSLWLALIGASRILGDPQSFSKLRDLPLENFEKVSPGKSALYMLAGEQHTDPVPLWSRGLEPQWTLMQPVKGLKGFFQQQFEFNPGPLIVSYAYRGQTMTLQTYGLANRATLLTFASQEGQARQIQQFIFPIHSLFKEISDRESYYLKQTPPLPRVRYMSTAQRLFAQQAPIEGRSYRESDHYWFDLLYHKWLDPLMALIACYELVRRGAVDQQGHLMREVLTNMRTYFPGIPDTEIIAKLLGESSQLPANPPLLLDGLMALDTREGLPLPASSLDYNGIWTMWRNAVALPGSEVAAKVMASSR